MFWTKIESEERQVIIKGFRRNWFFKIIWKSTL